MLFFIEILTLFGLICCLLWLIYGFLEKNWIHILGSIIIGSICSFLFFSDKTKNLEFEVFEDRINVYSTGSANESFKLDFKVNIVENENGDVYIPHGGDPRLVLYIDSVDGSYREKIELFADLITMKSIESNEHSYLTLTYKYIKKGNFWYNASMKPYEGKVWWTLYIPKDATIKEQ